MKKSEKAKIEKTITNILKSYDSELSFRFKTSNDTWNSAGRFVPSTKTAMAICHRDLYELNDTVAHEMAHAIQYAKTGETSCWTSNDGMSDEIKADHDDLTEIWKKDLQFLGFLPKF